VAPESRTSHLGPGGLGRLFRLRVGGLGGFLRGPEGVHLDLQAAAGRDNALFFGLHLGVLAAQVGEPLFGGVPAHVALVSDAALPCFHPPVALAAQLTDLLFQLPDL